MEGGGLNIANQPLVTRLRELPNPAEEARPSPALDEANSLHIRGIRTPASPFQDYPAVWVKTLLEIVF